MPFYILLHLKEAGDKLSLENFWKLATGWFVKVSLTAGKPL